MALMLKVHWDIKKDKVADFKSNQQALCKVMLEHPGVICYYADYPSEGVSEWVEIYANRTRKNGSFVIGRQTKRKGMLAKLRYDDAFRAHLANEKGKGPLGTLINDCDRITCRRFGNPDAASREILAGFGSTYHDTAPDAFALHPRAGMDSPI